tara:strand:+ start:376 stop:1791 length:1416 start_codon:yes stop_codon:yes gene_type:complete
MALWTKQELMSACNGSDPTLNFLNSRENINGISIDDRTIQKGELFIALIGENFDGHKFIESAIAKGACGVLVSNLKTAKKYNGLFVNDTKKALINIAEFARKRFKGITIGITGSSGKTSTNFILSSALNQYGKTHKTYGNNNNLIGLSLTLSRLPRDFNFCVLELGMNNSGEIRELTKIAKPKIAVITNVSNSHIQNFKNEKEIAKAKSEIFLGLEKNGVAIINSDNIWKDFLITEAKKVNARIHLFGHSENSNTHIIKLVNKKEGSTISYDKIDNWYLKYLNTTQAENVIASISVIKELKLPIKKVIKVISNLQPLSGRGEKLIINFDSKKKTIIIDDSYNANPASMKAALYNFNNLKTKYHTLETVLIIGDMLELGKSSTKIHLELIPILKIINPSLLITVGKYTKKLNDKLNLKVDCYSYFEINQLIKEIKKHIRPNQIVLLKGSNGTGLWKLLPIFKSIVQENANAA